MNSGNENRQKNVNYILRMVIDTSSYQDWCVRLSLEYTMKYALSVSSAIFYIIVSILLNDSYVTKYYSYSDAVTSQNFVFGIMYTAIACLIEYLTFSIINWLVRKNNWGHGMDFTLSWKILVTNNHKYLIIFVATLTHIMTDIFVGKIVYPTK